MLIFGSCPRSFCRVLIHLWPCFGIGGEWPGNSLPTYSSMAASVHRLQLVHSATSMIRFHFFIAYLVWLQNSVRRETRAARAASHPGHLPFANCGTIR